MDLFPYLKADNPFKKQEESLQEIPSPVLAPKFDT